MKKIILAALFLPGLAHSAVSEEQQKNLICYVKENRPDYISGKVPFSCDRRADAFVAYIHTQVQELASMNFIPNLDSCIKNIYETNNMVGVAQHMWGNRDYGSPSHVIAATAIYHVCAGLKSDASENTSMTEQVEKTASYKPFSILSSEHNTKMTDTVIANKFMCKTPTETLQDTLELMKDYDLVGSDKTDGTMTLTSFRGEQDGRPVTVSLAVDETSSPRITRYLLVDGLPAIGCK